MVWFGYCDDEPDTIISFDPVFTDKNDKNDKNNLNFVFDFVLVYRRAPEPDTESVEDLCNLETRVVRETHEFDRDWLIGGGRDQIQATVFQILEMIQVPSYTGIVHRLTFETLDLKKRVAMSDSPSVERVRVEIDVIVPRFPGDADDVDVELAVAPASDNKVALVIV